MSAGNVIGPPCRLAIGSICAMLAQTSDAAATAQTIQAARWPQTAMRIRMRPTIATLCLALGVSFGAPSAAFDLTDLTPAEREAFGAEVRAYLLDNPEVLLEAINRLEERQVESQAADDSTLIAVNAEAIFEDENSWVGGNPDGDVTLVEFADYSCGFCKRAYPDVIELLAFDGNVRFIVKEFPILGPNSEQAARFAIAVLQTEGDDLYAQVHDRLMTLPGAPESAALERVAGELGLDMEALRARMDSPEVTDVIEENRALAARLQINGTPTFVLADRMLRGYLPLANMLDIIDDVRAN